MTFNAKHNHKKLAIPNPANQWLKPLNLNGPYLLEYKGNLRVVLTALPTAQAARTVSSRYLLTRYLIISKGFFLIGGH
jgi:hypothetical protein